MKPPRHLLTTALAACLLVAPVLAQPTDRSSRVAGVAGRYDVTLTSLDRPVPQGFKVTGSNFTSDVTARPTGTNTRGETVLSLGSTTYSKFVSLGTVASFDPSTGNMRLTMYRHDVKQPSMIAGLLGSKPVVTKVPERVTLDRCEDGTLQGFFNGDRVTFTPTAVTELEPVSARAAAKPDGGRVLLKIEADDVTHAMVSYGPGSEGGWAFFAWVERPIQGRQKVVTGERVNLRTGPSTSKRRVTQGRKGECFEVLEEQGGWTKLALPDGQGLWASNKLLGDAGSRGLQVVQTLTLRPNGDGWEGTMTAEDIGSIDVELVRRRRVLVLCQNHYSDGGALRAYGRQVVDYYKSEKGYVKGRVVTLEEPTDGIQILRSAYASGTPYDRLVFIAHGGWDGPYMGSSQVSSRDGEKEHWPALVRAIKQGTSPGARIYTSSCHGGGSNYAERKNESDPDRHYVWSRVLANATGRTAAGPAGITSTEYTLQQVKAALEGEGVVKQETAWDGPQGSHRIYPGRSLQVELP